MIKKCAVGVLLVTGMLALGGCGSPDSGGDGPPTVRVAAASDLQFALEEISAALADAEPPVRLAVTYGSSGTFFQQISNGAPFDVYLSADVSYPEQLVTAGLADPADLFEYAVGRLVVWAPDGSPLDPSGGLPALAAPEVTSVAIANPEHAPYGQAAAAALTDAGVHEAVADKLVLGENVAQAAEFAASGNAQAAVVALSLVRGTPLSDEGSYTEVPLDTFPRLDQGGLVLGAADDRDAAVRLREFLTGDEGVAILERYGFSLPSG